MLSQHVNVSFPFTVEEIVAMGAGDRPRSTARPLINAAIAELALEPFPHRELPRLSGGEQQRAHFARVLVQLACGEETEHRPGVLLLDEPTSSLDLRYQINLVEIAKRRAREGTAVIAVLHDLNLAVHFADRIVVIHKGSIAARRHARRHHHQHDDRQRLRGRHSYRVGRRTALRCCCRECSKDCRVS